MQRICLFIASLKDAETVTRERSEDVFASLVSPAATSAGFIPEFILDDEPGTILTHVVRRIKACWVLVADLTGNNFSVGYEFAFAHMCNKPTIPLLKSGSSMPYDVQAMRMIEYDYTSRATLRNSILPLAEQLKRCKIPHQGDNPLQNALRVVEPPAPTAPPPAPPPTRVVTAPPPSLVSDENSLAGRLNALVFGLSPPDKPDENNLIPPNLRAALLLKNPYNK